MMPPIDTDLRSRGKNNITENNVLKHMSLILLSAAKFNSYLFIRVTYLNFISNENRTVSQNGNFYISLMNSRLSTP